MKAGKFIESYDVEGNSDYNLSGILIIPCDDISTAIADCKDQSAYNSNAFQVGQVLSLMMLNLPQM